MGASETAVLILGFGGPERPEDVRPFIERVVAGRNVPPARIELVVEQYKQIGGKSPYAELTRQQVNSLTTALQAAGANLPIYTGMLFCEPSISSILGQMQADGIKRATAVIMAPHRTEASFNRYVQAVETGSLDLKVDFISPWHREPLFIEAAAERVGEELEKLTPEQKSKARIIFTAHSVPQEMSSRSGYAQQIEESSAAVFAKLQERMPGSYDWHVAYQSRSGAPSQQWLEPDVAVSIAQAKREGKETVVVMPIGFLVDHVEVLYDLDILAAAASREIGLDMRRASTVGNHQQFIKLLSKLILTKLESTYARS
jgi:protoporphyrin/coproporphyrin ferrochelatase